MVSSFERLSSFNRAAFAHLPTRLEFAPRLSEKLGIELWIKRDDCTVTQRRCSGSLEIRPLG